jgi:3-deoxy-D-manno-octulosonate 8-phosphate phosphatase (KDO 8-P phosphatase)
VKDIEAIFTKSGGVFNEPPAALSQRLSNIKAILLDWDGVFNDGKKDHIKPSDFSEGNAMGINMMRFSFYLKYGYNPKTIIVTGEENPAAVKLAIREHFNAAFFGIKNKADILPILYNQFDVAAEDCGFVFDDILDLSLAEMVGLRMFINDTANPMLIEYVWENGLCEYISGHTGSANGLRECCELLIGLNDNYSETIRHRSSWSDSYTTYLHARNHINPAFYKTIEGEIMPFNPNS